MCEAVERYAEKYAERAIRETRREAKREAKRVEKKNLERNVKNLFDNGASLELVLSSIKGLSAVRIREIYARK